LKIYLSGDILVVDDDNQFQLTEKGSMVSSSPDPLLDETKQLMQEWWESHGSAVESSKTDMAAIVITGFVARTKDGAPATLKRSGSDYTATLFASLLASTEVTLWKTVNGVYTANPSVVPDAISLDCLNFEEASELAYFGGEIIHPSAMEPCVENKISIRVANVRNPEERGTIISSNCCSELVPGVVKAVTSISGIALFNVKAQGWASVATVAARVSSCLDSENIRVIFVTQSSSEHSISFGISDSVSTM